MYLFSRFKILVGKFLSFLDIYVTAPLFSNHFFYYPISLKACTRLSSMSRVSVSFTSSRGWLIIWQLYIIVFLLVFYVIFVLIFVIAWQQRIVRRTVAQSGWGRQWTGRPPDCHQHCRQNRAVNLPHTRDLRILQLSQCYNHLTALPNITLLCYPVSVTLQVLANFEQVARQSWWRKYRKSILRVLQKWQLNTVNLIT